MKSAPWLALILCILLKVSISMASENLYIFESSPKMTGYIRIGFVEIMGSEADVNLYTLWYRDGRIVSGHSPKEHNIHPYLTTKDGNVYISGLGLTAYSYENYIHEEKFYPPEVYNMLAPNFVTLTNYNKSQAIKSLLKKLPKKRP